MSVDRSTSKNFLESDNFHHHPEESNLTFCFIIKLQYARRFQGIAPFPPFPGHVINTNSFSCSRQGALLFPRPRVPLHTWKEANTSNQAAPRQKALSIRQNPLDISFLRSVRPNEIIYFLR